MINNQALATSKGLHENRTYDHSCVRSPINSSLLCHQSPAVVGWRSPRETPPRRPLISSELPIPLTGWLSCAELPYPAAPSTPVRPTSNADVTIFLFFSTCPSGTLPSECIANVAIAISKSPFAKLSVLFSKLPLLSSLAIGRKLTCPVALSYHPGPTQQRPILSVFAPCVFSDRDVNSWVACWTFYLLTPGRGMPGA